MAVALPLQTTPDVALRGCLHHGAGRWMRASPNLSVRKEDHLSRMAASCSNSFDGQNKMDLGMLDGWEETLLKSRTFASLG